MEDSHHDDPPPPVGDPIPLAKERWHPNRVLGWRSVDDQYVAGIAGGVGERAGIDPLFLRVGLVGLGVYWATQGASLVLPLIYAVAVIVTPPAGGRTILSRLNSRDGWQELVTALGLAITVGLVLSKSSFLIGGILCSIGWVLLRSGTSNKAGVAASAEFAPASGARGVRAANMVGSQWGRSRRFDAANSDQIDVPYQRDELAPTERPPLTPSLFPVALALVVAYSVGFATLDQLTNPGLTPSHLSNGLLVIVGGTMVMSRWRGRLGLTWLLAIAIAPVWVTLSIADAHRFPGDGTTLVSPTSVPEGGLTLKHGYGTLEVDLTNLDEGGNDSVAVTTMATAGVTRFIVPFDATVVVNTEVGVGTTTFDDLQGGFSGSPSINRTLAPWAPPGSIPKHCSYAEMEWWELVQRYDSIGIVADPESIEPFDSEAAYLRHEELRYTKFLDSISDAGLVAPIASIHDPFLYNAFLHDGLVWLVALNDDGTFCSAEKTSLTEDTSLVGETSRSAPKPQEITINATLGIGEIYFYRGS